MIPVFVSAVARFDASTTPRGTIVESRGRRGASAVTRVGLDLAETLYAEGAPKDAHVVFASAWGEIETALRLFEMRHEQDGVLSPARFKSSVHNTMPGLLGIATQNVRPHTALAAGYGTFAMGLLESIALVRTLCADVLLLVADEPPPALFQAPRAEVSGVGLWLRDAAHRNSDRAIYGFTADALSLPRPPSPPSAALPLLDALVDSTDSARIYMDEHMSYVLELS
jgi:hypothetical protein